MKYHLVALYVTCLCLAMWTYAVQTTDYANLEFLLDATTANFKALDLHSKNIELHSKVLESHSKNIGVLFDADKGQHKALMTLMQFEKSQ